MRCSRVQYLYEEYSAGTLEAGTATRLDRHLDACPACREYFEENDDVSQIISSSQVGHPGDAYITDLTSRVMEALCDDSGAFRPTASAPVEDLDFAGRASRKPLWWAGAVAALLLAAPMIAGTLGRSVPIPDRSARALADATDPAQTTSLSKSPQDLTAGLWGSVLPLGQGLVTNAIRPVSLAPSRATVERPAGHVGESRIELSAIEELLALEAVGTAEARQRIYAVLRELGETLHEQYPELERSGDLVLMKQTHQYHRAEDALKSGDADTAAEAYGNILAINDSTILARRAAMRLGDLNYYVRGNFGDALKFYQKAEDETAQLALTSEENTHVAQMRLLLDEHAASGFVALRRLHQLSARPWDEVPRLLDEIMRDPASHQLSAQIALVLMKRLAGGQPPADDLAFEMVDVIESRLPSWENSADRGWLHLLLGDIIWLKFESAEPALQAYRSALELNERSQSAAMARQRIQLLQGDRIVVFGR